MQKHVQEQEVEAKRPRGDMPRSELGTWCGNFESSEEENGEQDEKQEAGDLSKGLEDSAGEAANAKQVNQQERRDALSGEDKIGRRQKQHEEKVQEGNKLQMKEGFNSPKTPLGMHKDQAAESTEKTHPSQAWHSQQQQQQQEDKKTAVTLSQEDHCSRHEDMFASPPLQDVMSEDARGTFAYKATFRDSFFCYRTCVVCWHAGRIASH